MPECPIPSSGWRVSNDHSKLYIRKSKPATPKTRHSELGEFQTPDLLPPYRPTRGGISRADDSFPTKHPIEQPYAGAIHELPLQLLTYANFSAAGANNQRGPEACPSPLRGDFSPGWSHGPKVRDGTLGTKSVTDTRSAGSATLELRSEI